MTRRAVHLASIDIHGCVHIRYEKIENVNPLVGTGSDNELLANKECPVVAYAPLSDARTEGTLTHYSYEPQ
jgi:hypothetical protein